MAENDLDLLQLEPANSGMFTLHVVVDQLAGLVNLIRDLFQRLSHNTVDVSLVGYYNPVHCLMQPKQPRSKTPPTISMLSRGPS